MTTLLLTSGQRFNWTVKISRRHNFTRTWENELTVLLHYQTAKHHGAGGRGVQVSQGYGPDPPQQAAPAPRQQSELPEAQIRHQHVLRPQPFRRGRLLRYKSFPGKEPGHLQVGSFCTYCTWSWLIFGSSSCNVEQNT